MITFYVFLLIVAAVGALGYIMLFFSHVPGAKAERLGELEALPASLGEWVRDDERADDATVKETRYLLADPSSPDSSKILVQVRYRDPETDEIVRIEPETAYRRRRRRT